MSDAWVLSTHANTDGRRKTAPWIEPGLNSKNACIGDHGNPLSGVKNIYFPHQHEFLEHISVDIGGSLAKVVFYSPGTISQSLDLASENLHDGKEAVYSEQKDTLFLKNKGGEMHFVMFETSKIDECVHFVEEKMKKSGRTKKIIKATGGGAYKYNERFKAKLGVEFEKFDEMECLISGLNFLLKEIPYESFIYSDLNPMLPVEIEKNELFPYLLVNIGSGVSIVKVTGSHSFERISGSSLGGGTLWGLLSLLTNCQSFDEMLALSMKGENKNVDMLVGDIYGTDYNRIGLKASTIASSFGKVFRRNDLLEPCLDNLSLSTDDSRITLCSSQEDRLKGFRQEDIAKSLLYMVSNNIGQIAYLNALQHNLKRIYFAGYFIRGHRDTMHTISFAINFWSRGQMKAYFLRHEGYLGAVGAFISQGPPPSFVI